MAGESWLWNPGCGVLAMESWLWNRGCGNLAVESWLWHPGCGILAVEASGRHPPKVFPPSLEALVCLSIRLFNCLLACLDVLLLVFVFVRGCGAGGDP